MNFYDIHKSSKTFRFNAQCANIFTNRIKREPPLNNHRNSNIFHPVGLSVHFTQIDCVKAVLGQ